MSAGSLPDAAQLALAAGRDTSSRGRFYTNGAAYSMDLKLEVANTYQQLASQSTSGRPSLSRVADIHRVDPGFVKKIESELWRHGRVLSPQEIRADQGRPVGPGSISLTQFEQYVVIRLYYEEPTRTLRSYVEKLWYLTGTKVSLDTIRNLLLHGFPHKGSLVKPNLVPYDKFKPENQVRAFEYLKAVYDLHPDKVVFGDEKHLKSEELFSKKVRKDPLTGETPPVFTDPDFRNAYNITGFCSINTRKVKPIWFQLFKGINNAAQFYDTCVMARNDGFFEPFDVLLIDNATVHNEVAEMLWNTARVHVLFLPARCPEWNPKELVWRSLVSRMRSTPLSALEDLREICGPGTSITALTAADILNNMTFDEVRKYFSECYDFFPHWRNLIHEEFRNNV